MTSLTTTSSSRKRVAFTNSDTIVSLPPYTLVEPVSETERPQIISSAVPPLHSPGSTASTPSTLGPYTPPSNAEGDISIEDVTANSQSVTPPLPDAVGLLEAKVLDTYEPYDFIHPCLTTSNPIHWNMLINPQIHPPPHALDEFGHDFMTHNATVYPISKIHINCDILPWPIIIDVKQDGLDRSPRVEDIFNLIYVSLRKLASSVDLNHQTTERQYRIRKAYRRRCRQSSISDETDGLRRIDFLEGQTMFLGLYPGKRDDEWHLAVGEEY